MKLNNTDLGVFTVIDGIKYFERVSHRHWFKSLRACILFKIGLIGNHTYIFDHTPVDTHSSEAHPLATLCQRIQKSVCCNITSLTTQTDQRGSRRKHDKAIQWFMLGEKVKIPGTFYLGIEDPQEFFLIEFSKRFRFNNTGCMHHTF
jgi:hypothetical protein